ncbi:MAG: cellulase family glycosylhydrolase [Ruminiclostridium sp.]|nr:cellulase family glycosylhydrolase [Ruminiclostridium sp.]
MEKIKVFAAVVFAVLAFAGCTSDKILDEPTPVTAAVDEKAKETAAASGGFTVSGSTLLDANGNVFIMRGINHAHTWYKNKDDTALEAIAATGSNCVRLVLANGIQWEKDSLENINRLTDKCRELKMVAILEVHDGTGNDDPKVLDEIADYWIEMKDALIGKESYVILNIANEWFGSWGKNKQWADAYIDVIPKLRDAGIKNTVMVDAAGWGQLGECIASEGKRILASDTLSNTMFSVHMYGTAGGSKASIKKNIDGVLGEGLCLCIGEFGYTHSDGDVKEDYLMEYCVQTGVGYLGWSWKGNSGGVEYLDIAKEWDGSVLSGDWGEVLVNGANGIRETSEQCTVF